MFQVATSRFLATSWSLEITVKSSGMRSLARCCWKIPGKLSELLFLLAQLLEPDGKRVTGEGTRVGVLPPGGWPGLRASGSACSALRGGLLGDSRLYVTLLGGTQIKAKISQKQDLKVRDTFWILTNLCELGFFPPNLRNNNVIL